MKMKDRYTAAKLGVCLLIGLLSIPSVYATPRLNSLHPSRYVVKKGDTLWDISSKFLKNPWEWPSLWKYNPHIYNPHLIYPGDVLVLHLSNGQHFLEKENSSTRDHVNQPLALATIKPFLNASRVLDKDERKTAPYIVGQTREGLVAHKGSLIYARGIPAQGPSAYSIFRMEGIYRDPVTHEILGYAAFHLGEARLISHGTLSRMVVTDSRQEILDGDRLLPTQQQTSKTHISLQAPLQPIQGLIISVIDGVSQIGQHNVVVINRGERDHLQPGNVLAIYQSGHRIVDPIRPKQIITLPDERAGELLIFRTFPRVSMGLVVRASKTIHLLDSVRNP